LIIPQYSRCCILRLPQRPLLQLSLAIATSWLRRHIAIDFRRLPALRLDRWSTPRLGSALYQSARPAAYLQLAPAAPLFRPTGGDPPRLASNDPSSGKADDQPPTRIGAVLWLGCLNLRLSPVVVPAPRLALHPVCTGCFTLRLHRP